MLQATWKRFLAAGLLVLAGAATAGGIVGRITGLDLEKGRVEISGIHYRIASSSLAGKGPEGSGSLTLRDLRVGQVVQVETVAGRVSTLRLLRGVQDIPH